jgi:hypothetical protein
MANRGQNVHQGTCGKDGWSIIEQTPLYVEKLLLLCHSQKELQRVGYVTTPFSDDKLNEKRRCQNCGCEFFLSPFEAGTIKLNEQARIQKKKKTSPSSRLRENVARRAYRARTSAEANRPPSGADEHRSATQTINAGGSVEERLQDMQVSDQTNASDEQKGELQQYVSDRIVCTYHPGRVREKVLPS